MAENDPGSGVPALQPIVLKGAEEVRLTYADAVYVSYGYDDFTVAFFQSTRPVIVEGEASGPIEATCVGRFVLSPRAAKVLRAFMDGTIPHWEAARAAIDKQDRQE